MTIAQDKKLVYPVTYQIIDYGNLVRRAWGAEWSQRDVVYKFSNNRVFRDSTVDGGPYKQP